MEVVLDTGREKLNLEIEGVKFFKQFVILKFKGLDNINDIEKYRQKSLYVTRKNAVRLQRDEYFIADLIGLKVQDEDGTELGTVKDVIETGANDVYEVEMADGQKSAFARYQTVYTERGRGERHDAGTCIGRIA